MSFLTNAKIEMPETKQACLTREDKINLCRERLSNWATKSKFGKKKKNLGTNNLLVWRKINGNQQRVIKIPVANQTVDYWEIDPEMSIKENIQNCINSLDDIGDNIEASYDEMLSNLRKARNGES